MKYIYNAQSACKAIKRKPDFEGYLENIGVICVIWGFAIKNILQN
jgi:hypothetical protein